MASRSLLDAVEFLNGSMMFQPFEHAKGSAQAQKPVYDVDFSEVKGQTHAIRALEIAAAGGHNVLDVGALQAAGRRCSPDVSRRSCRS